MQTDDAKAKYEKRQSTAEPIFGILETILGFTRFRRRGRANVKTEWLLATPATNCKRLCTLKAA